MPASMTGCSMPSSSVRRVRMSRAFLSLVSWFAAATAVSAAGTVATGVRRVPGLGRRGHVRRDRSGGAESGRPAHGCILSRTFLL